MIFMVFMIDITSFPHGPNPKEKIMALYGITLYCVYDMKFRMSELCAFLDTSDSGETCE